MELTARLRVRRPFEDLTPDARHSLLRGCGMFSPNAAIRTDTDAFEVRVDVSVEDACLTSLRLVRMALAQLELLNADADLDALHRDTVDGIACLARLACGAIGVVQAALCHE